MRRLLVAGVLGLAIAVTGCKGVSVGGLDATSSPGSGSSSSSGSSSGVQAAGPVSGSSGALKVLSEPQAGFSFIYTLINGAKSSVELTMYTLRDTTAENDLAAAAKRGVNVRVILDQHLEKKFNTTSYGFLSAR